MRKYLFEQPVSLRFRLTLFIGLVSVGVLLGFGRYIEYTVEEHFIAQDAQELMATVQSLQSAMAQEDTASENRLDALRDILAVHHGIFAYIEDEQGRVVFAPDSVVLADLIRQKKQLASWLSVPLQTWHNNENSYRIYTAKVQGRGGETVTILTGMDIRFHQHFLQQFQKSLWLATLVVCLMMIGISWLLIKKGHQPLRKISHDIQNITSEHLHTRLVADIVPEELKGLVLSFNAMIGNIEEVFERQSHFSADIAHELRTPVTNLITQTQIVLGKARTLEEYQDVLYSNLEEFERMSKMVNDMLFLAQADSKQAIPERVDINLETEIQGLFEYIDAWAEEKGIVLTLTGENTPIVYGDKSMIRRALSNLLSNAIHYAKPNTGVQVCLSSENHYVALSVSNESEQEIPQAQLERLFERFYRADTSRQHKGAGAGIGLAIVKSVVDAHKGSIAATSTGGRVSFIMKLPY